jgi:hypothetical protein
MQMHSACITDVYAQGMHKLMMRALRVQISS